MISRGKEIKEILEQICLTVEEQADQMLCSFLLSDKEGKYLLHGAAPSLPKEYVEAIDGAPIGPGVGSCGTASYLKKQVIVSDIENDPIWKD